MNSARHVKSRILSLTEINILSLTEIQFLTEIHTECDCHSNQTKSVHFNSFDENNVYNVIIMLPALTVSEPDIIPQASSPDTMSE